MPLLEVAFEVPAQIVSGLASGKYSRYGGVIRDAANGTIVTHLREGGQMGGNADIVGRFLKPLFNASTGGLGSTLMEGANVAVTMRSHHLIMQQLQGLTTMLGFVGGVGVVNLALSAVSLGVVLKRFGDIEAKLEQISQEFERDRNAILHAGLDAARDAAVAAEDGDQENRIVYSRQAIDRLRQARRLVQDKTHQLLARGDNHQLLSQLSLATHLDTVLIRCYLDNEDLANANRLLRDSLATYRCMTRITISKILGTNRAVYFHNSVDDLDLWRFVHILRWQSDRDLDAHETLAEALMAERQYFWNTDVVQGVEVEKRQSIRDRLSPWTNERIEDSPPHILALAQSDILIENYQRLQGFQAEIEAIDRLGISHSDWELMQNDAFESAGINLADHDDFVALVDS